ncbi:MAG: sugar phosphate isomerase/epimerase [Clostridiales bacterium]|nr:sugar phosphate isomerase/epimerase [Clostridiales bacterium]
MFKVGFRSYVTKSDMEMAKNADIEVVEVMWEDKTRERADEVKGLLKDYGIKPSAMVIYPQRDLKEFRQDIAFAESIKCPVYVGHPAPLKASDMESIKEFKKFWTSACKVAGEKGIRVSVHSCGLNPESWDIMFNAVPELGLKYDPSFTYQGGRNIRMELLKYGEKICHVHAKDEMLIERTTDFANGILHFKYAPAGMGDIHWGSVIALLYEVGYKGDIAIEPHSDYWCSSEEARRRGIILAKRHLEQFIAN